MKFEYKMLERVYPVSESELDALGSLGCTVTTETQEDSIIEESEEDIKIDLISENGFSREVTFYERN